MDGRRTDLRLRRETDIMTNFMATLNLRGRRSPADSTRSMRSEQSVFEDPLYGRVEAGRTTAIISSENILTILQVERYS